MTERVDRLTRRLREVLDEPGLSVRPWRAGVDFWADLVETGTVLGVVRSPRTERLETTYEGAVDFGAVIEKEAVALELMAASALPVPRVLARERATESWILLSHVPHEPDAAIPPVQLGRLARRLHGIRPRTPLLGPQPSWAAYVVDRLRHRLEAARAYCPLPDGPALEDRVTGRLSAREPAATSLLHMDLRPGNVCVLDGRVTGLIDVANCLVGDPLMELGRLRAYGLLDEGFRTGYGTTRFTPAEAALLDIYELDTALLLTVVSVEEFDDPALHRAQASRATALAARIAGLRGDR